MTPATPGTGQGDGLTTYQKIEKALHAAKDDLGELNNGPAEWMSQTMVNQAIKLMSSLSNSAPSVSADTKPDAASTVPPGVDEDAHREWHTAHYLCTPPGSVSLTSWKAALAWERSKQPSADAGAASEGAAVIAQLENALTYLKSGHGGGHGSVTRDDLLEAVFNIGLALKTLRQRPTDTAKPNQPGAVDALARQQAVRTYLHTCAGVPNRQYVQKLPRKSNFDKKNRYLIKPIGITVEDTLFSVSEGYADDGKAKAELIAALLNEAAQPAPVSVKALDVLCQIKNRVLGDDDFSADEIVALCESVIGKYGMSKAWCMEAAQKEQPAASAPVSSAAKPSDESAGGDENPFALTEQFHAWLKSLGLKCVRIEQPAPSVQAAEGAGDDDMRAAEAYLSSTKYSGDVTPAQMEVNAFIAGRNSVHNFCQGNEGPTIPEWVVAHGLDRADTWYTAWKASAQAERRRCGELHAKMVEEWQKKYGLYADVWLSRRAVDELAALLQSKFGEGKQ